MSTRRLDRRITFQKPTVIVDHYGGTREVWEDILSVWATLKSLTFRQRTTAPGPLPIYLVAFEIRYRKGIEPNWRIIYDGEEYRIKGIAELGRREWLEISAERVEVAR